LTTGSITCFLTYKHWTKQFLPAVRIYYCWLGIENQHA